jgi:hypothetical protein
MNHKDFEKIRKMFSSAVDEKKILYPLRKYEEKTRMKASNYMVYSFAALPLLIEKMKQLAPWDERNIYSARFLVEEDGSCWFALEGSPGDGAEYASSSSLKNNREEIPAHSDITPSGTCVSSGIIVFSKEYQIEKISNFSGHYRPEAGSLVWIIASLLKLGANFASNVELIFFWKKDNLLRDKKVSFTTEELNSLIPEKCVVMPNTDHRVGVFSNEEWIYFTGDEVPEFKINKRAPKHSITGDIKTPSSAPNSPGSISIFSGSAVISGYDSPITEQIQSSKIDTAPFSDDESLDEIFEISNSGNCHSPGTMVGHMGLFGTDKLLKGSLINSPQSLKSTSLQRDGIKYLIEEELDSKTKFDSAHVPSTMSGYHGLFGAEKLTDSITAAKSMCPPSETMSHLTPGDCRAMLRNYSIFHTENEQESLPAKKSSFAKSEMNNKI